MWNFPRRYLDEMKKITQPSRLLVSDQDSNTGPSKYQDTMVAIHRYVPWADTVVALRRYQVMEVLATIRFTI